MEEVQLFLQESMCRWVAMVRWWEFCNVLSLPVGIYLLLVTDSARDYLQYPLTVCSSGLDDQSLGVLDVGSKSLQEEGSEW